MGDTQQGPSTGQLAGGAALLLALLLGLAWIGTSNPTPTPPTVTSTSLPTTTSASTTTLQTTTTTTQPPAPAADGRMYGDTASWNRPATDFAVDPLSAVFTRRLFDNANLSGPGKVSTYFYDWSYPTFTTAEATTTIRVFHSCVATLCIHGSLTDGETIPWNPAWHPPDDNDRIMIILDPPTGREWDLWLVHQPGGNQSGCVTWTNFAAGILTGGPSLCVGQGDLILDENGHPADYRTSTSTYPVGGAWMQAGIGLVHPQEVAAGSIRHALNMIVADTMFGPACPKDSSDPGFGTTCGSWVPPASRLEWASPQPCGQWTFPNTTAGRSRTVPEGARFAIHKTRAQINAWLDSRGFTGKWRETARIFAVAASDLPDDPTTPIDDAGRGVVVENTSCWDAGVFTTGLIGPDAAAWTALGVPADHAAASGMLDGLITSPDDLVMLTPPAPPVVGIKTRR